MYFFSFFQVWFSTAPNVRVWFSSEEAQLKDELFSNTGRCALVSCFLIFPSHALSRVFCITSVACLIKLFCSSAFTSSVSLLLCSVCSAHVWTTSPPGWERSQNSYWSHLKTSSNKPDWALWCTNSQDENSILLLRFPPCQLTRPIPLMSCSSFFWQLPIF